MTKIILRKGHGYETGRLGRCTAFDGFTVIRTPMGGRDDAGRASRCGGDFRCDYSSHSIRLAVLTSEEHRPDAALYILMQHGGGRVVYQVPSFYDHGALRLTIAALPEPVLYGLLYTICEVADRADEQARREVREEWAQAFVDKRIRKVKRGGSVRVFVESEQERDERTAAKGER